MKSTVDLTMKNHEDQSEPYDTYWLYHLYEHRLYFILFYFILFYFILFYFILFYFILFYFILFYFILFYFILFYFILFYFILFYFILFYFILFYFYVILCYFMLFYFISLYYIFSSKMNMMTCTRLSRIEQEYETIYMYHQLNLEESGNWFLSSFLYFKRSYWFLMIFCKLFLFKIEKFQKNYNQS